MTCLSQGTAGVGQGDLQAGVAWALEVVCEAAEESLTALLKEQERRRRVAAVARNRID